MGWESVVHGGEDYLIDEGCEALFFETARVRCVSGEGEGPCTVRGTGHLYSTLHGENTLEHLDIHLGRLGHLGHNARVSEHVRAHLGFTLLKLQDALLD